MRQRPQETLDQLVERFPDFDAWWKDENAPPEDGLVNGVYYQWSHHSILQQFLQFFGSSSETFTKDQLQWFGRWVNAAVSVDDELENAVATCFLEHAHQLNVEHLLAPYLSARAKERLHA